MTITELATLVIRVLDGQQAYFKSARGTDVEARKKALIESKVLEGELRRKAEAILRDAPNRPDETEAA